MSNTIDGPSPVFAPSGAHSSAPAAHWDATTQKLAGAGVTGVLAAAVTYQYTRRIYSGDRGAAVAPALLAGASGAAGHLVSTYGMFTSMLAGALVSGVPAARLMHGDGFGVIAGVIMGVQGALAGIAGGAAGKLQSAAT